MELKRLSLVLLALICLSTVVSGSSGDESAAGCGEVDVNSDKTNIEIEENVEKEHSDFTEHRIKISGFYCANTTGYKSEGISISVLDEEINVTVHLERPGENQTTSADINKVEYNLSRLFRPGNYELNYEVEMGNETLETGSREIEAESRPEQQGFFNSLIERVAELFSQIS